MTARLSGPFKSISLALVPHDFLLIVIHLPLVAAIDKLKKKVSMSFLVAKFGFHTHVVIENSVWCTNLRPPARAWGRL